MLVLRYRVGEVPEREDLRVRVTATSDDGAEVALSPAVRVVGPRLPRIRLRTQPGTSARRAPGRRRTVSVGGQTSPRLQGRLVTVEYASARFTHELDGLPRSRFRRLGRARVARDGTFDLGRWRPPLAGRAYELVASTPRTSSFVASLSCPVRFVVSARR